METQLQLLPFFGQPDFLLDLCLKSTAILIVALFLTRLLKQASAAVRHSVWGLALLAVLALPLVNGTMPKTTLPALSLQQTTSLPSVVPAIKASRPLTQNQNATARTATLSAPRVTSSDDGNQIAIKDTAVSQSQTVSLWNVCWLIGAALMLCRLALLQVRLWSFSRHCENLSEGPLFDQLQSCRVELNGTRPVRLLVTDQRALPMTWGVRHPSILLPRAAQNWTEQEIRSALLHELAHVSRRDCLLQLFVQLTCAVYWFHPLVWLASRNVHFERERACDDIVLQHGTRASDYADQLLKVVSSFRADNSWKVAAVSMAATSGFAQRLKSILHETRDRRPVGLRTRLTLGIAFLVLTGLLSGCPVAFTQTLFAEQTTPEPSPMQPQVQSQAESLVPPMQTQAKTAAPAKSVPGGGPDVPLKPVAQSQQPPAQTSVQESLPEPPGKVILRNGRQEAKVFEGNEIVKRSLNIVFAHDPGIGNYDGVVGRPQDIWNMVDLGTTAVDYTRYSDAMPSTVRLRITRHDGEWGIKGQSGIFQGYIYHNCRCVDLQTRVLDLPGGKYKIYVFAHGDAPNQNAKIELKVGKRVIGQKATASDGTWNYRTKPFREGVQYVSFDFDIKAGQELTLTSFRGDSDYSMFNAIQIVPQTDPPPAPQAR